MKCPTCESDNTQRLEVAYQFGTQDISTRSNSIGIGLARGGLGIGSATTSTSGQSQSIMAQKAAPPTKKSYKWPLILLAFGLIGLNMDGGIFVGLLFAAVGGYFLYTGFTYNKDVWPDLYTSWTKGWICHKCGNIYSQASVVVN